MYGEYSNDSSSKVGLAKYAGGAQKIRLTPFPLHSHAMPQYDVSNTNLQASSRPPAKERTPPPRQGTKSPPPTASLAQLFSAAGAVTTQLYTQPIPGYVRPHSTAAASERRRR